jgi:hypothetical protein
MENFINIAKQFAGNNNGEQQQYGQQEQQFGQQGGAQFNAPHGQGGSTGGFGDIMSMCE